MKCVRIIIVVNGCYKNKLGEYVDDIQWYIIVGWGLVVECVEKVFLKGLKVMIFGWLFNCFYELKIGEKCQVMEIVMNEFIVFGIKFLGN